MAAKKTTLARPAKSVPAIVQAMGMVRKGAPPELAATAHDLPAAERGQLRQVTGQLEARDAFDLMQIVAKAAERDWRAAAWLLERRYGQRWGRATDVDREAVHAVAQVPEGGIVGAAPCDEDHRAPAREEWLAMLWRIARRHEGTAAAALSVKASELALAHMPKPITVPGWTPASFPEAPATPTLPADPDDDDPSWT